MRMTVYCTNRSMLLGYRAALSGLVLGHETPPDITLRPNSDRLYSMTYVDVQQTGADQRLLLTERGFVVSAS